MEGMKCNCGGIMKKDKVIFEGLIVDGFKCSECANISFTPEQDRGNPETKGVLQKNRHPEKNNHIRSFAWDDDTKKAG